MIEKIKKVVLGDEVKRFKKRGGKAGSNCKFYNVNYDYGHTYLIEIGNNVTLAPCTILCHDASTEKVIGYTKLGKVVIGNNVYVGQNAIILPNVNIGDNCVIGAGSIVTKDIPDGSVAVGNPCKVIGSIEDFKKKNTKLFNDKPHFEKRWIEMSQEDIDDMICQIDDIGYTK